MPNTSEGSAGVGALSPYQIGQVIASTAWGFSESDYTKFLDRAIAVCLAESHGDPQAINRANRNGSVDYGLWQINSVHSREFSKNFKGYTELWSKRMEPTANTIMAKEIYRAAGGFTPWSTYNSGAYRQYLGHGAEVHKQLKAKGQIELPLGENDGLTAIGTGIVGATDNISGPLSSVLSFTKDAGITVGAFLLGAVLLILGVWFLLANTKAGKSAIGTATTVAKVVK